MAGIVFLNPILPERIVVIMPLPASTDFGLGPYCFALRNTDTDFRDRLHLASLFSLMQEAAYMNAEVLNLGASRLDGLDLCWLLARISVRLTQLPHWGNTVWVKTWSRGAQKMYFIRDFTFHIDDPAAQPFGHASSEWLVARRDSHRPQRPDLVLDPALQAEARVRPSVFQAPCPRLPALDDPADTRPLLVKYADYSDIDRNRHVNNTRYIAWCMDAVYASDETSLSQPVRWTERIIRGLDINYLSEVRLGHKILLFARSHRTTDSLDQADPVSCRDCLQVEGRQAESGSVVFRARVF